MKKGIFSLLTALILLVSATPCIEAASIVDSGKIGFFDNDNIIWTLDSEGTLRVKGTGSTAVDRFDYFSFSKYNIRKAIIEKGVTNIGDSFRECKSLISISLPEGIGDIVNGAFADCTSLVNITLPNSCTGITSGAFEGCLSLKTINIPAKVNMIYAGDEGTPFIGCTSLESINVDKNNPYFYSVNGNLFGYPRYGGNHHLIKYASAKQEKSYTIPYGCDAYSWAFEDCDGTTLTDVYTYLDEETVSYMKRHSPNLNFHIIKPCSIDTLSVNNNRITVNLSNVSSDCELITAFYSGNEMIDIKTTPLKSGDTQKMASVTNSRADSAKMFIWNSLDSMQPLCEAKSITIK